MKGLSRSFAMQAPTWTTLSGGSWRCTIPHSLVSSTPLSFSVGVRIRLTALRPMPHLIEGSVAPFTRQASYHTMPYFVRSYHDSTISYSWRSIRGTITRNNQNKSTEIAGKIVMDSGLYQRPVFSPTRVKTMHLDNTHVRALKLLTRSRHSFYTYRKRMPPYRKPRSLNDKFFLMQKKLRATKEEIQSQFDKQNSRLQKEIQSKFDEQSSRSKKELRATKEEIQSQFDKQNSQLQKEIQSRFDEQSSRSKKECLSKVREKNASEIESLKQSSKPWQLELIKNFMSKEKWRRFYENNKPILKVGGGASSLFFTLYWGYEIERLLKQRSENIKRLNKIRSEIKEHRKFYLAQKKVHEWLNRSYPRMEINFGKSEELRTSDLKSCCKEISAVIVELKVLKEELEIVKNQRAEFWIFSTAFPITEFERQATPVETELFILLKKLEISYYISRAYYSRRLKQYDNTIAHVDTALASLKVLLKKLRKDDILISQEIDGFTSSASLLYNLKAVVLRENAKYEIDEEYAINLLCSKPDDGQKQEKSTISLYKSGDGEYKAIVTNCAGKEKTVDINTITGSGKYIHHITNFPWNDEKNSTNVQSKEAKLFKQWLISSCDHAYGRYIESLHNYNIAIKINSEDPYAYSDRGWELFSVFHKLGLAEQDGRRANVLSPNKEAINAGIARLSYVKFLEEYDEQFLHQANSYFKRKLLKKYENPVIFCHRAMVKMHMVEEKKEKIAGEPYSKMYKYFEKAIEGRPHHGAAHYYKGYLKAFEGKCTEALKEFETAKSEYVDFPDRIIVIELAIGACNKLKDEKNVAKRVTKCQNIFKIKQKMPIGNNIFTKEKLEKIKEKINADDVKDDDNAIPFYIYFVREIPEKDPWENIEKKFKAVLNDGAIDINKSLNLHETAKVIYDSLKGKPEQIDSESCEETNTHVKRSSFGIC